MSAYGPSFPVEGGGGAAAPQPVTPPAPTSESVASGGSPSNKTFGSFTDPDSRIDNFNATITNVVGSTSISGSGLGAYSFSGSADGNSFVVELDARDASNNILATAVHAVSIAAASGGAAVTPPAATSESVSVGGSLAAKTFGSFTDPDSRINNFLAAVTNTSGSASVSGSGLGAYTFSNTANGDSGTLSLTARDSNNATLATATHSFRIAPASGGVTAMVDLSGVGTYNFLTTGGSGGSGGEGAHSVGGLTINLSFRSTSGPDKLQINNGVIEFEGSSSKRALLTFDLGTVSTFMFTTYCSIENADRSSGSSVMALYIGENTGVNSGDQAQFLIGSNSDTVLLIRENTTSSPAFVTVKNQTVTDVTSTPTRVCCQMLGGAWQPSFDQGTAALPTTGAPLGSVAQQYFGNNGTAAPESRQYVLLNLIDDCDVRVAVYKGSS